MGSNRDLSVLSREELEEKIRNLEDENKKLCKEIQNQSKRNENYEKSKILSKKKFDFSKYSKRHILLKFAYLGWDRKGFVVQDDFKNTVEAELFDALLKTKLIENRESSNYHRCGRTDKGVSAFEQTISITVRSNFSEEERKEKELSQELNYSKILNRVLPHDIRIFAWSPVTEGFSARMDCKARMYKYFFPRGNLDLKVMNKAAQFLVGDHDYRNFCKMDVGNGVVNFMRKILSFSISNYHYDGPELDPDSSNYELIGKEALNNHRHGGEYDICVATIKGAAFLWHQIRAIMTVLFLVGQGKEDPSVVQQLLDVQEVSRRPQYGFANEIALNLYRTHFEDVEWVYDEENLLILISQLQSIWAEHSIKSSMLLSMLKDLSSCLCNNFDKEHPKDLEKFCLQDPKAKVYKPLMERDTCESLEERVKYFVKRRRLSPSIMERVKL